MRVLVCLILALVCSVRGGEALAVKDVRDVLAVTVVSFELFQLNPTQALMTLRTLRGLGSANTGSAGVLALIAVTTSDNYAADFEISEAGVALTLELGSLNVDFFVVPEAAYAETDLLLATKHARGGLLTGVSHVLYVHSDVFVLKDPLAGVGTGVKQACAVGSYNYRSLCGLTAMQPTCQMAGALLTDDQSERVLGWAEKHQVCGADMLLLSTSMWTSIGAGMHRMDGALTAGGVGLASIPVIALQDSSARVYEQLQLAWSMAQLKQEQLDGMTLLLSGFAQPSWLQSFVAPMGAERAEPVDTTAIVSVASVRDFSAVYRPEDDACVIFGRGLQTGVSVTLPVYQQAIGRAIGAQAFMCSIVSGHKRFFPPADFLEIGWSPGGWGTLRRIAPQNRGALVHKGQLGGALSPARAVWSDMRSEQNFSSFADVWNGHVKSRFPFANMVLLPAEDYGSDTLLPQLLTFYSAGLNRGISDAGIRVPCVVVYRRPADKAAAQDARTRLQRLGLQELVAPGKPDRAVAVGAHCMAFEVRRAVALLPPDLAAVVKSCVGRAVGGDTVGTAAFEGCAAAQAPPVKGGTKEKEVRTNMVHGGLDIHAPGGGVAVLDKAIPESVLDMLTGRLAQIPPKYVGADSFFIPFDRLVQADFDERAAARSAVEYAILKYIAPSVLGDLKQAVAAGYLGAEWWVQTRQVGAPKEYHLDTAITWCRDNGWPTEFLPACHWYPSIGTVVYLNDVGGPTAIFNQSLSRSGITPTLPKDVALVYPRRNRIMAFDGKLYHGVLQSDVSKGATRATLLVNYWRNKTAGEEFTPTAFSDDLIIHTCCREVPSPKTRTKTKTTRKSKTKKTKKGKKGKVGWVGDDDEAVVVEVDKDAPHYVQARHVDTGRGFMVDFHSWLGQTVPEPLLEEVGAGGPDGFAVVHLEPEQLGPGGEDLTVGGYSRWMEWELDRDTGALTAPTLDLPAIQAWRSGMPGGNPFDKEEDGEQEYDGEDV